jgi:hypothetical protein
MIPTSYEWLDSGFLFPLKKVKKQEIVVTTIIKYNTKSNKQVQKLALKK